MGGGLSKSILELALFKIFVAWTKLNKNTFSAVPVPVPRTVLHKVKNVLSIGTKQLEIPNTEIQKVEIPN